VVPLRMANSGRKLLNTAYLQGLIITQPELASALLNS
jgi:hypothetical protein